MKFKWSKNILKGLRGALFTAGATLATVPATNAVPAVVQNTNELADTLAVALVEGNYSKAKIVALSAVLGFCFEVARNLIKNREKLGVV